MSLLYVGIDNGVTGSVAGVSEDGTFAFTKDTPVFETQDYTKKVKRIHRVDTKALYALLRDMRLEFPDMRVFVERPMVNPGRFMATASALRALEATLIVLENAGLPVRFLDSKEWQKKVLPTGVTKDALKTASMDIGERLFPQFGEWIRKHKDADGLLIAEFARREKL